MSTYTVSLTPYTTDPAPGPTHRIIVSTTSIGKHFHPCCNVYSVPDGHSKKLRTSNRNKLRKHYYLALMPVLFTPWMM